MKNFFKKLFCSDSMSKHFSETVQRIGKNNAGFSLVELIVVIAIMAILAAVAVIGVSVYIPKAQQASDEQMIADIKTAIDLYSAGETLTPGQSGYVVIHKNKGTGEVGNVTVGGAMDQMITEALLATYGDKYGTELKVAYQKWTGTLDTSSASAITNSSYSKNPAELLGDVQLLTNALSGYYGGGAGSNQAANDTVLEIAFAASNYIDQDTLIAWWKNPSLEVSLNSAYNIEYNGKTVFNVPEEIVQNDPEYVMKSSLALIIARVNAFVNHTGCPGCMEAYATSDTEFKQVSEPSKALEAVANVEEAMDTHIRGCADCQLALHPTDPNSYWNTQAENDAKGYVPVMNQITNMSTTIKNNEAYTSGELFTSDFVGNAVSGYIAAAEVFDGGYAQDGDIVVIAIVDNNGNLTYKVYPIDY